MLGCFLKRSKNVIFQFAIQGGFFNNIMTPGGVLEHCNLGGSKRQKYIDNFDRSKHIHICV